MNAMNDYIKREDAKELFEMLLESYKDNGIQNITMMLYIAPKEFNLSEDEEVAEFNSELDGWRNNFMEIESADVAPVRHGQWININEYPYEKCSICGETHDTVRCLDNYCPNCGAKMDEEVDA